METLDLTTLVRPGRVERVEADRVLLDLGDHRVWATPAMAIEYDAVAGDDLLAAGGGDDWYIIGVIRGEGRVRLVAAGDVEIASTGGEVHVRALRGVSLQSPVVSIASDALQIVSNTVRETCCRAFRCIRDSLDVRAGRSTMTVDKAHTVDAERIIEQARKEHRIDGETIHLG